MIITVLENIQRYQIEQYAVYRESTEKDWDPIPTSESQSTTSRYSRKSETLGPKLLIVANFLITKFIHPFILTQK